MTRQKKEIIKKMDEIRNFIYADTELGCGFAPAGAYDDLYDQLYDLQTELSQLRGFESFEAECDADITRIFVDDIEDLPFN